MQKKYHKNNCTFIALGRNTDIHNNFYKPINLWKNFIKTI